jgi:predicted RNA-binding Zn-ribbon protein involved in translation (DUF1610 family)
MTHDTPHEQHVRWCEHCELTVEPVLTESGLECPSCGQEI